MTNLYYNWLVSTGHPTGVEWISAAPEEGLEKTDWNGNTIMQRTQRELSVAELATYADEIVECYFGPEGFTDPSDRQDFVAWIGDGGEAVAEKVDWNCKD